METTKEVTQKQAPELDRPCSNASHLSSEDPTLKSIASFLNDPIDATKTLFPLENYSQSIDEWLLSDPETVTTLLMDSQRQQQFYSELKAQYFSMGKQGSSPWNSYYVQKQLDSRAGENYRDNKIEEFASQNSICFGENFRLRGFKWKNTLQHNSETGIDHKFCPEHRAITLRETLLRCLPTQSPAYGDPRMAGEGYPFDNLQDSSLMPATPIYILSESCDGSWKYVLSPHKLGWIRSKDVATVDKHFVDEWLALAEHQLATVINAPVTLKHQHNYYFTALPGTFLPALQVSQCQLKVAIPVGGEAGSAKIKYINVSNNEFIPMPLDMTRANLACVLQALAGKPYGWGNYNFNNDCSAELQRLLIPFGILLPRDSAQQIAAANRTVDLSQENVELRLNYLKDNGIPFRTLIYLTGHIMLYIGNFTCNGETVIMTYQNIWGLRPANQNSRSIIGGSVFFPLLARYPEDPDLVSTAAKKVFKLGFIE